MPSNHLLRRKSESKRERGKEEWKKHECKGHQYCVSLANF
jgi:hypothetical protein